MVLFVVVFIASGLSAYDQAELFSLCGIYYSTCETTTNCDYPSTGSNACNTYMQTATEDCNSETTNHDFAKCFMNYDTMYFTNCTEYKYLSVCLFEETKDIYEFSCYNGKTTAVDCLPSLLDGIEFNLQSIDYDADSVPRGSQYWTVLTMNFGSFNITNPPDDCVVVGDRIACIVNPWLIPHMNLHACLLTQEQTTCSCLMLESTEGNATVTSTDSNAENPNDGPFDLPVIFQAPGRYRLIAHIQFYEDIGNGETIFWDLANGIEVIVIEPEPTNFPTIEPDPRSTSTGSTDAIVICLVILGCYLSLFLYYKCYYEPRKYVMDDEYDMEEVEEEDDSFTLTGDVKDDDSQQDTFVTTGVEESKER